MRGSRPCLISSAAASRYRVWSLANPSSDRQPEKMKFEKVSAPKSEPAARSTSTATSTSPCCAANTTFVVQSVHKISAGFVVSAVESWAGFSACQNIYFLSELFLSTKFSLTFNDDTMRKKAALGLEKSKFLLKMSLKLNLNVKNW